jgi:Nucleotidyl transferase
VTVDGEAVYSCVAPILLLEGRQVTTRGAGQFARLCAEARDVAAAGEIVTFGITPDRPTTGYGYIHPAEPLAIDAGVRRIERFVEKPDEKGARTFIKDGYLWNSGNFVFRADGKLERRPSALDRSYLWKPAAQLGPLKGKLERRPPALDRSYFWNPAARLGSRKGRHPLLIGPLRGDGWRRFPQIRPIMQWQICFEWPQDATGPVERRNRGLPFGESVVTELPLPGSLESDDSRFLTIVARTETEGFSLVSQSSAVAPN